MAKAGILEWDGEIVEVLPAGKFRVQLKDTDLIIMCYKAGKMKQSHISVIAGDWVKVEVNQYDMTQGRIVYRYNPAAVKAAQESGEDIVMYTPNRSQSRSPNRPQNR